MLFEHRNLQAVEAHASILRECGLHPSVRQYSGQAWYGGDPDTDASVEALAAASKGVYGIRIAADETPDHVREWRVACYAVALCEQRLPYWGVLETPARAGEREALLRATLTAGMALTLDEIDRPDGWPADLQKSRPPRPSDGLPPVASLLADPAVLDRLSGVRLGSALRDDLWGDPTLRPLCLHIGDGNVTEAAVRTAATAARDARRPACA